jgi:hypothetical protein
MTNSMRKRTFVSWFFAAAGPLVLIPLLAIAPQSSSGESVRSELIRLQDDRGLTLSWVDSNSLGRAYLTHSTINSVQAISFKKRIVVQLQDSREAFRPEGFNSEEYPGRQGIGGCWSHNQKTLAAAVVDHSTGGIKLEILDVKSKKVRAIAMNAEQRRLVTEECWSQDDRKLVSRRVQMSWYSTLRMADQMPSPRARTLRGRRTGCGSHFEFATRTAPRIVGRANRCVREVSVRTYSTSRGQNSVRLG